MKLGKILTTAYQQSRQLYDEELNHIAILLDQGAYINAINYTSNNDEDQIPLIMAADRGWDDLVKMLLERGCDMNAVDFYDNTALHIACRRNHLNIVSLLLDAGIDANTRNHYGHTALIVGCIANMTVCRQLVSETDINICDDLLYTALSVSCTFGYTEIVKCLLEKGCDINAVDGYSNTALHGACHRNHMNIVSLLLDAGIDANALNYRGKTALIVRCEYSASLGENMKVCRQLVSKTDINVCDDLRRTALMSACISGCAEVVKCLLQKGCDVNFDRVSSSHSKYSDYTCCNGGTALQYAVLSGDMNIIKLLLNYGADVNIGNRMDLIIMPAISKNSSDMIKIFIQNGLNHIDYAPISQVCHMAVSCKSDIVLNMLYESGILKQHQLFSILNDTDTLGKWDHTPATIEWVQVMCSKPMSLLFLSRIVITRCINLIPGNYHNIHMLNLPQKMKDFLSFDDL